MRRGPALVVVAAALLLLPSAALGTVSVCVTGLACANVGTDGAQVCVQATCVTEPVPPSIPTLPELPGAPALPATVPHAPILVQGDAGFLAPTSGVLNPLAAGTAQDPYVIQGWQIQPVHQEVYVHVPGILSRMISIDVPAIQVQDTDKHVIIRGNWLHDMGVPTTDYVPAIYLSHANNVTIENNSIEDVWQGILVQTGTTLTIQRNSVLRTIRDPVELAIVTDALVKGNNISYSRGNAISSGIVVEAQSKNVTITRNVLSHHATSGVFVQDSFDVLIESNVIADQAGGDGILIRGQYDPPANWNISVIGNLIERNYDGVAAALWNGSMISIHDNDIANDQWLGVAYYWGGGSVDARMNWWGCPEGPNQPGCDRTSANVDASKWLTSPVPISGA